MKLLKERILSEGRVKPGNILKVDTFLNHQLDIGLLNEVGKEFARLFKDDKPTKILTVEASGIGIAALAAQHFGNLPVIFAKKSQSKNLDGELLTAPVRSYTRGVDFEIHIEKKFVNPDDRILIIDDFLARGQALLGLIQVVKQAGAQIVGCGIVIEKGFQDGGGLVRETGVRLESLAVIKEMSDTSLVFEDED